MKRKLLSGLLICVLALAMVFGLTACKMSTDKYQEAVNEMIVNYYANHKDSSNFGDITLNYTITQKAEEENDLFADKKDTYDVSKTVKVATKKIGDFQTLQVEYTITEKSVYFISENDAPVQKDDASVESYKYVYGYINYEGQNEFYAIKEESLTENGEPAVTTKQVEFLEKEVFIDRVDSALSQINQIVAKAFNTAEDSYQYELAKYNGKATIEKEGEVITYNEEYTMNSYHSGMVEGTSNKIVTFANGAPEKIVMALNSVDSRGETMTGDAELNITYSADYALISDVNVFDGYNAGYGIYANIPSFSISY